MTNAELLEHIASGKPMTVHLSKGSFALVVDGIHHIIDEAQACILWDALPLLASRGQSFKSASPST